MSPAFALARWGLIGAWRDRLFASIVLFFVVVGVLTPLVQGFAIGAADKAARDVGLSLLWLFGSGTAVLVGVRAIGSELRDGTAALWLTRPISRGTWVAGRALGAVATLTLVVAGLVLAWTLVALWNGVGIPADLPWFAVLLWVELVLVAAWALFFTSLTTSPIVAFLATLGLWAAGHLADEYGRVATGSDGPLLRALFHGLYLVVPDLDLFDVQDRIVHLLPVDGEAAGWAVAYGLGWALALTAASAAAISRRDLA